MVGSRNQWESVNKYQPTFCRNLLALAGRGCQGAIVDSHQRTIIDTINRNGEILEKNGHVHCEQKDFTCPVKLLKHCINSLSKSPAKQYHPLKQLREAHHKAQQEQQRQLERSKDFGISL